ncbi:MAG: polyhydroxyalkanoic acid system family protein [Pseudomonadota bacterium]
MADIHIVREHGMSMADARKAAFKWAEQAEEKFDMECTYEEGKTSDEVSFTRSGVNGTLTVNKDSFELQAKLGFLLGAFKDKIEGEIVKNLDALIAKKAPAAKKPPAKKAPAKKA